MSTIIPTFEKPSDLSVRSRPLFRAIATWLLRKATKGKMVVEDRRGAREYGQGELVASVVIRDERAYRAILLGGSQGFGASYVKGWWDSDDLTATVGFVLRNLSPVMRRLDIWGRRLAPVTRLTKRLKPHTRRKSKSDIIAHYDLGNDFYALMLDETMMYSCAFFVRPEVSLFDASTEKLDRLCRKLNLTSTDRLLEIGTGWGGFAVHAAANYGCHVTTVTISDAQYAYASQLVKAKGLDHLIDVRNQDYRDVEGQFDKVVSIEMIEAIGWRELDRYFATCAARLAPGGVMALQAITINDLSYERAKNRDDFIKAMIFPGGFLPSLEAMTISAAKAELRVVDVEDIGRHYAETLRRWGANLEGRDHELATMGLGPAFLRLWHMYLCYCEAAFLARHISDVQIVLSKPEWIPQLGTTVRRYVTVHSHDLTGERPLWATLQGGGLRGDH
jgi:cyclopropane-fatty-acyl-phospholipid synthase